MTGTELIAKERERQMLEEGYTYEHDDEHDGGALAIAAACYASPLQIFMCAQVPGTFNFYDPWPWEGEFDKRPRDSKGNLLDNYYAPTIVSGYAQTKEQRIRQLAVAGALIAAEIDRLLRLQGDSQSDES
jgi:hypothetical protein